jgi:hypothetical protein
MCCLYSKVSVELCCSSVNEMQKWGQIVLDLVHICVQCRTLRLVFRLIYLPFRRSVSFRSPYLFYLLTVGVEVVYFHVITLRHTPQSVGLLWTRDRPVAETCTWQHKHSQETIIHAPGGIRTHDPSKRSAADLGLRPRGCWDLLLGVCGSNSWKRSLFIHGFNYISCKLWIKQ